MKKPLADEQNRELVYQNLLLLWYHLGHNSRTRGSNVATAQIDQREFDTYVQELEQVFDQAVVDGDDDELFASGYLRGHFDLVVAQLELQEQRAAAVLPAVQASLDANKHELAPADQQHIADLMAKLARV